MPDDMFEMYLARLIETEAPNTYHRWSLLAVTGAWLGRRAWVAFGDSRINSNLYVMLMGKAGARKSTAIKQAVKLIKAAGYTKIAAEKTSKEKFLLDLAGESQLLLGEDLLNNNLFGSDSRDDAEVLIAADEFNVFLGNGNIEFLSLLGTLWDYEGNFDSKVKNSVSAGIYNPTISILAGNTATNFALAFPVEAIGQGIFSRLLIIQGYKTGKQITVPPTPDAKLTEGLIERFQAMQSQVAGEIKLSASAYKLLDKIYKTFPGLKDVRFESYNNRRLTHLIKLSLITAASKLSRTIEEIDIIKANTILVHAEYSMPKALGEFGKARHSDITNKIINILEDSHPPIVTDRELWKQLYNDLESVDQMKELLTNLHLADKVMRVPGANGGWISKTTELVSKNTEVDFSLLTEEERNGIAL